MSSLVRLADANIQPALLRRLEVVATRESHEFWWQALHSACLCSVNTNAVQHPRVTMLLGTLLRTHPHPVDLLQYLRIRAEGMTPVISQVKKNTLAQLLGSLEGT